MKICIVDDSPVVTAQVRRLVSAANLGDPVVFHAAEEAMQWCFANSPPVVLVDFGMPHMNGLEFLKRLKGNTRTAGVAVGLMTGWSPDGLRERAAEVGAAGLISKPLDEDEFHAFVLMLKGAALEAASHPVIEDADGAPEEVAAAEDRHTLDLSRLVHEFSSLCPSARVADRGLLRRVVLVLAESHGAPSQDIQLLDAALRRTLRLMPSRRQAGWTHPRGAADEVRAHSQKSEAVARAALELLTAREPDALKLCAQMVMFSGECWDGSGGPLGIRGIAVPFPARLFSLARRFVSLAAARTEASLALEDAGSGEILDVLRRASGREFDPSLVRALTSVAPKVLLVHRPEPGSFASAATVGGAFSSPAQSHFTAPGRS